MFSNKIHLPNWMPNSSVLKKFFSLSLQMSIPVSVSLPIFLMYLFACLCGSIIRGQRRDLSMIMPFSIDSASLGREQTTQCWILIGSPRTFCMLQPSVWDMSSFESSTRQSSSHSLRTPAVKGPTYDTMPAATMQSPGRSSSLAVRSTTFCPQRAFSPPRPPMSLCARTSFTSHRFMSSDSSFCLAMAPSKLSSRLAILAFTAANCSCAFCSFSWHSFSSISASASCLRLGSTALATKWYLYMARHQRQRASQAIDAFLMAAGSKSSRSI
mmetsp:Transcript_26834/g.47718  ORF Transcript_26834/g.47718 Transcript_26834/m.47718 type:complete len:270 (+) Transcript_26834:1352-2161(+)